MMQHDEDVLLEVKNLKTHFSLRQGVVKSVDGVNLKIKRGQTLGVVGESGCGKSVTAQSILRIVPSPGKIVEGEILLHTKADGQSLDLAQLPPKGQAIRQVRGGEISMIFQEPMASLSPVYTIGNQIIEMVYLHQSIGKAGAKEQVLDMLARVGFAQPARTFDAYPHELSGGMRQRAVIAMALMGRPSLLIADEPTTALDVTTEAQILRLLKRLQAELGMAIMFITHDLGVIAKMADQVAVMYLGKVVEQTDVDSIFYQPKHPYLRALLDSVPQLGGQREARLKSITGMVPDPFNLPSGCPFYPRCPDFIPDRCDVDVPGYVELGQGNQHGVACHLHTS
ncbi:MAG: ABC transporter ATP-binding protein [Chloroflexota bacterium]